MTCAAIAGLPTSAWAGVVTSSLDNGTSGTLRNQIAAASSGDTITFNPGINPTLTAGQILIPQDIVLVGNGMGQTRITGSTAGRVFEINLGTGTKTVTIKNLSISGGHAPDGASPGDNGGSGGGILATFGGLLIDGVELNSNLAGNGAMGQPGSNGGVGSGGNGFPGANGGQGGAILAAGGPLTVMNSNIHDNFAGNGGTGGTGGSGSAGAGNGGTGGPGGPGGGIVAYADAVVTNTTFATNHAGPGGTGGDGGPGTFPGNGGTGGQGGSGGGFFMQGIFLPTVMQGSTFSGNVAGTGGTGGQGGFGAGGGVGGSGGGLYASGISVSNSTLNANLSGPGGTGVGGLGAGGNGGDGGGVYANGTGLALTIAGNVAALGGSGPFANGTPGNGGGFFSPGSSAVNASVIAGNLANSSNSFSSSNCVISASSSFVLSFPAGTGCPGAVGDPRLGALANNGGPTRTMALGAGSAAIDQVPVSSGFCPATDQRGVPRPQIAACDIGAFEVVPPAPAAPAANQVPGFDLKAAIKKCKKKFPKGPKRKKCIKKAKRRAQR